MASAFTHAIASVAIGQVAIAISDPLNKKADAKFWLLAIFCAVIPDADAIGFWMGVPYESVWGHRGITHSLIFAVFLSLLVLYLFYREEKIFTKNGFILFLFFFVVTASHGFLDAMTTGGRGVAFFAPVSDARYFFAFRPIVVSPLSVTRFFSSWGWMVIKSEIVWVWVPSFILVAVAYAIRTMKANNSQPKDV